MNPDITLPKEPKIKVYSAILSQTGTNAPVANVLQNTYNGTIVWTRTDVGKYLATCTEEQFTENKTSVAPSPIYGGVINGYYLATADCRIETYSDLIGTYADGLMSDTLVEIKTYNL